MVVKNTRRSASEWQAADEACNHEQVSCRYLYRDADYAIESSLDQSKRVHEQFKDLRWFPKYVSSILCMMMDPVRRDQDC